jgi:aryl-alcohol dehydrogenase-like predicted oxidoreductase
MGTGRLCSLNGGLSIGQAGRLLRHAFELGVRFIDTAPTYGQGHAERAIGRLPPAIREEFTICTKVGYTFGRKTSFINAAKPLLRSLLPRLDSLRRTADSAREIAMTARKASLTIEPDVIQTVLHESLRRMRRDSIDLLMLHDPSQDSVANHANQDELGRLADCGKIRAWGVSTSDPDVLLRAADAPGCSVVQFPVNRVWMNDNPGVLEKCAEGGLSIIANSVFANLAQQPDQQPGKRQSPTAEQSLAFAIHQPGVRMVLCGTRNREHLTHSVEAMRKFFGHRSINQKRLLSRTNQTFGATAFA